MYCIYWIVDFKNTKTYLGFTDDLKERIKEHKSGTTRTTKNIKNFKYCVIEKDIIDLKTARAREKYWKSAIGRKRLKILYKKIMVPSSNG